MLSLSYEEVSNIVKQSKLNVECDQNYNLLHKKFLQELWDNQKNHQILFSIAISPDSLSSLNFENLQNNLSKLTKHIAITNFIKIDNCGNVVETINLEGDTNNIKSEIYKFSMSDYVFFFGEEGITRFINGTPYEDVNIFYSRSDRMKYKEKKDISKIHEVIDNYSSQYLTQQVNYMCLLADNATLRQIDEGYVRRNILKNRPEQFMRDQLCQYLTENMRYTFTTEPELGQTKKELDIYFDVSGELYFIEIKWLGISINNKGTGLSTEYTDSRAREGVIQTLEYIKELLNTSEKSLRQGYLLIYDARDEKKEVDFQKYSFIREDLKSYFKYFSILGILPLVKRHPA